MFKTVQLSETTGEINKDNLTEYFKTKMFLHTSLLLHGGGHDASQIHVTEVYENPHGIGFKFVDSSESSKRKQGKITQFATNNGEKARISSTMDGATFYGIVEDHPSDNQSLRMEFKSIKCLEDSSLMEKERIAEAV